MHASFAAVRRRLYMAPEPLLTSLSQHASGRGQPMLVVEGQSGSGKSALLANWISQWREAHPEDSVFYHFTGCDAASTRLRNLMSRLLVACASGVDEAQRLLSEETEGMVQALPALLGAAAESLVRRAGPPGNLIIVLDALNQLENESFPWLQGRQVHKLGWLPSAWPPNVRVIVSTLPGQCQQELRSRRLPRLETYPLSQDDCRSFIEHTMSSASKKLSAAQMAVIMGNANVGNPLFLKLLLEELISFGLYEKLDDKVKELSQCADIPHLLVLILERLEASFKDAPVPHLIQRVLRCIGIGREGIMEVELQALCGMRRATADGQVPPGALTPFMWSSLYFAIQHLLVDKSGAAWRTACWPGALDVFCCVFVSFSVFWSSVSLKSISLSLSLSLPHPSLRPLHLSPRLHSAGRGTALPRQPRRGH